MKYDNLHLVVVDADGDLDIVTTEQGAGITAASQEPLRDPDK